MHLHAFGQVHPADGAPISVDVGGRRQTSVYTDERGQLWRVWDEAANMLLIH